MEYSLSGKNGLTYRIETREIKEHDPALIKTVVDIDLMTWSEQTFSRYTAALMLRQGRTFVLLADNVPIGTCQCIRSWERPSEAVLFSISIRPGWRGRGLGTRFMEDVFDGLRRGGIRTVVLSVTAHNAQGIRKYEELFGFSVVGVLPDEYAKKEDEVLLRKVLQPDLIPVQALPDRS
ncbi:MAG: GNAT family N-acetyltransferase [Proteobacteria bacterium]|nr:GNAT family N-acetyltransferase [Pseudomonadota bacterium]MCP4919342.1 GNAT family N-acetyltransferase [Pseudomonadota bacterium]